MFKRKSKRNENKVAEGNILLFKNALQKLPLDVSERQVKALIKVIEYTKLQTTERIVIKRIMSPGLYIVVSGIVEAISNSGIALRRIKKGDFFGDVSTFFGTNSPVTVRAQEG